MLVRSRGATLFIGKVGGKEVVIAHTKFKVAAQDKEAFLSYSDYAKRKKQRGEKPLPRKEWEARAKAHSKQRDEDATKEDAKVNKKIRKLVEDRGKDRALELLTEQDKSKKPPKKQKGESDIDFQIRQLVHQHGKAKAKKLLGIK